MEPHDTAIQDEDNASQAIPEESRPDEDINEEIYDPNALAEVILPSCICQLQLFMFCDLLKRFVQIDNGPSMMLHSSFSNPCSQL